MFYWYMKILNVQQKAKCPKTDLCGTPQVILEIRDAKLLTATNCLGFPNYDSNNFFANPRIPCWHNSFNRML